MLKLLGIRSWIGLAAVLIAAAAILAIHGRLAAWWATGQHDGDWRQRELAFLTQLYDRLEAEQRARSSKAPASLRGEQEAILQRIAETAKPIRAQLSPEIAALLAERQRQEAAKPAAAPVAIPAGRPVALHAGAALPGLDLDLSAFARDPDLDRIVEQAGMLRGRAAKPAKKPSKPAEEPAAAEAGGKAKE